MATLKTLVVSCIQQGYFIPLLLNLFQPYASPNLSTCIFSTWEEDPCEWGCQLVFIISRVPSNVPGTQEIFDEHLLNVWAPSMSKRCAFSSYLNVVLITHLQVRYHDSYHPNKLSGTQIGEVTCSKLHSWWLMDSHLSVKIQSSCFFHLTVFEEGKHKAK